jgi:hypothetical protein
MTLAGARFTEEDARWVVEALLLKRDADSLTAAVAIQAALESGAEEAALTPREDDAVAAVVEEAWRARDVDETHLLVNGVLISDLDARMLMDLLTQQSGTKEELLAAGAIEYALAEKLPSADLSDTCRRAILRVLTDPTSEQLRELHATLVGTLPDPADARTS